MGNRSTWTVAAVVTVRKSLITWLGIASLAATPAGAAPFFFSTGDPNGLMATASRPDAPGKFEIESADDFVLNSPTVINRATFIGLLVGANVSNINEVTVEMYRVFPQDSNVARTSGPPTFSTPQVPTRVNSPSDVAFDTRSSTLATLTSTTTLLSNSFTVNNSILPGSIHPFPNQTTGGNGPLTGAQVRFDVTFTTPFTLAADHYFFVPQVGVSGSGNFFWLSTPRPITTGTPFTPDLQSWTRDQFLDPDWFRVGTDLVGGGSPPTFNAAFSLSGDTVPEPSSVLLLATGLAGYAWLRKKGSIR